MFSNYFTVATALVAIVSAAPVFPRGCAEGKFNCIDGKSYAQCISGGTWGPTMSVAPGTECAKGISDNPWLPVDGSSPPPASSPPPVSSPPPPPPPPPAQTPPKETPPPAQAPPPPPPPVVTPPPTTPSGDCSNNAAQGKFADISCWQDWESMKNKYLPILGTGCSTSWGAINTKEETAMVFSAIEQHAGAVDKRFILALVVQESSGCVRVITTNNGVRNPGLLQDANGAHTCNDNGVVQTPCPEAQISGMIDDGINQGDNHLSKALQTANSAGFLGAKGYAVASRIYNSGSYDANNLANGLGSTGPYVDQILNRLVGTQL